MVYADRQTDGRTLFYYLLSFILQPLNHVKHKSSMMYFYQILVFKCVPY